MTAIKAVEISPNLGNDIAKAIQLPGLSRRSLASSIQHLASTDLEFRAETEKMNLLNSLVQIAEEFEVFSSKFHVSSIIEEKNWKSFEIACGQFSSSIVEPLFRRSINKMEPANSLGLCQDVLLCIKEEVFATKDTTFDPHAYEAKALIGRVHKICTALQKMSRDETTSHWAREIYGTAETMCALALKYSTLHVETAKLLQKLSDIHSAQLDITDSIAVEDKIASLTAANNDRHNNFSTLLSTYLLYVINYYGGDNNFFTDEKESLQKLAAQQRENWVDAYKARSKYIDTSISPTTTTKKSEKKLLVSNGTPFISDHEVELEEVAQLLMLEYGFSSFCPQHYAFARKVLNARKTSLDVAQTLFDLNQRVESKVMKDLLPKIYANNPTILLLSDDDLKTYASNLDAFYKHMISCSDKGNRLWTTILFKSDYAFFAPHSFHENVLKYWPDLRLKEISSIGSETLEINILSHGLYSL